MKPYKIIFIAMILFLLPSLSYSSNSGAFRLSFIKGDVRVKTENTTQWISALINMPLMEGDRIEVPEEGRLEIQMREGSFLRIDENSSLVVRAADTYSFQFYLEEGHAYVNFRGGRDSVIEIETPVTLVRAHDSARFRIDQPDYGNSEISVFKGLVYAESVNGTIKVHAGKTLSLRENNYADMSPLGLSDEWERWNRERDRRGTEQLYSSRYLPEELRVYSYDFDNYGEWVYSSEYGYVWTPRVVISSGWSPYRIGRWVWRSDDYVWVSYEPWGWVPYHYGRWTFRVSIGWFWVPPVRGAVYWGSGYVGWVYTPAYVAWIPLAPKDIYYGYGYYGPRSVNIININVRKKVIKNVYRNVYVDNAVTVVHRSAFSKGRHRDFAIKKNPFLQKNVSFGRPGIKQRKTSFTTTVKKIQRTPKYSQSIRDERLRNPKKRATFFSKRTGIDTRSWSQQKIRNMRSGKDRINRELRAPQYRDAMRVRQIQKQNQSIKDTRFRKPKKSSKAPEYRKERPPRHMQIIEKRHEQGYESIKRDRRYKKPVVVKRSTRSERLRYTTDKIQGKNRKDVNVSRSNKYQNIADNRIGIQKGMKGNARIERWSRKKQSTQEFGKHITKARPDNIRKRR